MLSYIGYFIYLHKISMKQFVAGIIIPFYGGRNGVPKETKKGQNAYALQCFSFQIDENTQQISKLTIFKLLLCEKILIMGEWCTEGY